MSVLPNNVTRLSKKLVATMRGAGLKVAARSTLRYVLLRAGLGDAVEKRRLDLPNRIGVSVGETVKYGPLRGLKLPRDGRWSGADRAGMLLGFYEKEVLDQIAVLAQRRSFGSFIDIGAADGYYGIGVLAGNLFERSYCFEISDIGCEVIRANAAINGVADRVSIFGRATRDFADLIDKEHVENSVVLVDIEGGEFEILDKNVFRKLSKCAFIVEIHGWVSGALEKTAKLKDDASEFYDITELKTSSRDLSGFDELKDLNDSDRWLTCSEGRPRLMSWLVLMPRCE